jgi:hypothetical protein
LLYFKSAPARVNLRLKCVPRTAEELESPTYLSSYEQDY